MEMSQLRGNVIPTIGHVAKIVSVIATIACVIGLKNAMNLYTPVAQQRNPESKYLPFLGVFVLIHNVAGNLLGIIIGRAVHGDYMHNGRVYMDEAQFETLLTGMCVLALELALAFKAFRTFPA